MQDVRERMRYGSDLSRCSKHPARREREDEVRLSKHPGGREREYEAWLSINALLNHPGGRDIEDEVRLTLPKHPARWVRTRSG